MTVPFAVATEYILLLFFRVHAAVSDVGCIRIVLKLAWLLTDIFYHTNELYMICHMKADRKKINIIV